MKSNLTGLIFDIKKFAIHDGPGIRTTMFFKGCPLSCSWCHNPESRACEPEEMSRGKSSRIIGRSINVEEALFELLKDRPFYEESDGGVTFSGGEPLMQPEFLLALLKLCRIEKLHTAVDTTGYSLKVDIEQIVGFTDLFLYDLKLIDDSLHLKETGVSNKPILENLKRLNELNANVNIRVPLIPGITDIEENLTAIAQFIEPLNCVRAVSLLPYNMFADDKNKRYSSTERGNKFQTQSKLELSRMAKIVASDSYEVRIGG